MEPLEPVRNGASRPVQMYGEFMGKGVRYAVSLSERELTVRKLCASGKPAPAVFSLADCLGSRAHRDEEEGASVGASFSAYFYPFRRRRWAGAGAARHRVEQRFRVNSGGDARANLEEARRWARAIREGSMRNRLSRTGGVCAEVKSPCRVLLLLNPLSGKGQAHTLFTSHVQQMLQEASIPYTLTITERQNHARELVREADLSQWDALAIMSGDGLLFEVVNGLMERDDWEEAIKTPLGVLPGGSGNAVAASMHHYCGLQPVSGEELLVNCGFMLCKGLVSRLDLTSVCMASSQRLFSFLSLAWGFVADVDIESEKYRHVGAARFTLGTLVRLASLRIYQGKLSYLPAEEPGTHPCSIESTESLTNVPQSISSSLDYANDLQCQNHPLHNSCNSNNALKPKRTHPSVLGPPDSLLVPLDQPVPAHWTVVNEENFVLVLAAYQSHLAEDLIAAPASRLEDGVIHLIYVTAGISRAALLRLFLAMEKGTHLSTNCPNVVYVKARALRLEPLSPKGTITVDGELVEYGPVQAQVHSSLARLIAG
ncbi:sphingosine kinase 1 [Astyanax mexicanus]|uniref:sphingosine kinase 1 n=1 Tax=Astyanax mexicanus TaxID=7994 RepID=UPI0020CB2011|nr:sphingosine kinase 1 [Astyanax mexicanus]